MTFELCLELRHLSYPHLASLPNDPAAHGVCSHVLSRLAKLEAVAKAAAVDALFWNEEYCNSSEAQLRYDAWQELKKTLKELNE